MTTQFHVYNAKNDQHVRSITGEYPAQAIKANYFNPKFTRVDLQNHRLYFQGWRWFADEVEEGDFYIQLQPHIYITRIVV